MGQYSIKELGAAFQELKRIPFESGKSAIKLLSPPGPQPIFVITLTWIQETNKCFTA